MSAETTARERVAKMLDPDVFALRSPANRSLLIPPVIDRARALLAAALDDPDLAPQVSWWRRACEHSRVLNPKEHRDGETAEYEQACSPCLRDRMRAWLLDGVS